MTTWTKERLEELQDLMDQKLANLARQKEICETLRGMAIIHLKLMSLNFEHDDLKLMRPSRTYREHSYKRGEPFNILWYGSTRIDFDELIPYSSYTLKLKKHGTPTQT